MDQHGKKGKIQSKEKNIIECYQIWHQYNDVIKGLERTEKSWVWSNDKKKMSGEDTSSTPGTMYRKWREQKDMRMKKENCNITPIVHLNPWFNKNTPCREGSRK